MIRQAVERDFSRLPNTECAARILSLKIAYGLDVPFIRYYTDGDGGMAAIMDGVCTLQYTQAELSEEWLMFLRMVPDTQMIHTDEITGNQIVKRFHLTFKSGSVMRLDKYIEQNSSTKMPRLQDVYILLADTFRQIPPFESWYVDISHRVRHGFCHITSALVSNVVVSCAMTVAETHNAAIIGSVATKVGYRGQGLATRCIKELLDYLPQNTVFILPNSLQAERVYQKCGFTPSTHWMEIALN